MDLLELLKSNMEILENTKESVKRNETIIERQKQIEK